MHIFLSGDPHADFDAYDRHQQEQYDKLPKCQICNEPITDNHLYDFYGKVVCECCADSYIEDKFKREVVEYIE